jgi:hypothetical protein
VLISSELKLSNGWRFCLWPFRQDDFFRREDANDWLRNFLTRSEDVGQLCCAFAAGCGKDTSCSNHGRITYQRALSLEQPHRRYEAKPKLSMVA